MFWMCRCLIILYDNIYLSREHIDIFDENPPKRWVTNLNEVTDVIYKNNSLMPPYGPEVLRQEELEDLLSYLDALRGK